MKKFATCEAVFLDASDAHTAVGNLAAQGIAATQFTDVKDPLSDTTLYYGLWRLDEDLENFEAAVQLAVGELGRCDLFGLSDHKPIAADFFDVSAEASVEDVP